MPVVDAKICKQKTRTTLHYFQTVAAIAIPLPSGGVKGTLLLPKRERRLRLSFLNERNTFGVWLGRAEQVDPKSGSAFLLPVGTNVQSVVNIEAPDGSYLDNGEWYGVAANGIDGNASLSIAETYEE